MIQPPGYRHRTAGGAASRPRSKCSTPPRRTPNTDLAACGPGAAPAATPISLPESAPGPRHRLASPNLGITPPDHRRKPECIADICSTPEQGTRSEVAAHIDRRRVADRRGRWAEEEWLPQPPCHLTEKPSRRQEPRICRGFVSTAGRTRILSRCDRLHPSDP